MRLGLGMGTGVARGGAAPYFPATLGDLVLALDARSIVPAGGLVATWPDLSAAPFTVAQGTEALRPDYIADAGDGLPTVDFTGTEYLLGTGVPLGQGGADYTLAALVKPDSDGYLFGVVGSGVRIAAGLRVNSAFALSVHRIIDDATTNGELSDSYIATGGYYLAIARRITATMKLRVDGRADVTVGAPGGALTLTSFSLGAWLGASSFFDGQVAGIWGWSDHISDAACDQFRTWLQGQRAITP